MNQLKALGVYLHFLCWLSSAPVASAHVLMVLSSDQTEMVENEENDLAPLSQLPAWGVFCYNQYPADFNKCLLGTTLFTQLRILDWSYQSPHSDRFWHDAVFWMGTLVIAIESNQGLNQREFPDLKDPMIFAITIRMAGIGADTGVRVWGYQSQNIDLDIDLYNMLKDFCNSVGEQ